MSKAESEGVSQRTAQFLRNGLGKSDSEIEQLREQYGELLEPSEGEDLEAVEEMLDEETDEENTEMTETTANRVEEQLQKLEEKSEQLGEVLDGEVPNVGIEVVDEDLPVISMKSVRMMPTELVNIWFDDLLARLDSVVEIAERREQERQELQRQLDSVERALDGISGGEWARCKVDKAYDTQEKLLHDGQYCSLGSDFADRLGITEGDKVRVRQASEPAKAAVYTVYEVGQQDAKLRIAKKGRKRVDQEDRFKGEITPI